MTATTFSRLPLLAGGAVAAGLGRAGLWTISRYMRAPLASTGMLALVTMTALAASNALYFQTTRHPSPFFAPAVNVTMAAPEVAPIPQPAPVRQSATVAAPAPTVTQETTGSVVAPAPVVAAPPVVPTTPVGNTDAFAVQKKLAELGLFAGKVDGFYGPMTANAIRAFEQRNGMEPTGAMTPDVIDAILRADAAGMVPVAQAAPVVQPAPVAPPAPVAQQAVAVPTPTAAPQPDRLVARLPALSPVDQAVDTIGDAAAQTIDSIVAAVDGGRNTPPAPAVKPVPALPLAGASAQQMPAPVQVASLEPMRAPQPVADVPAQAVSQPSPAVATVAPANNVQLVSTIQRGLASLGFYHGSIDGHPGDATAKAIREFENFHSYRVTGQVKPDLVDLLRQAGAAI